MWLLVDKKKVEVFKMAISVSKAREVKDIGGWDFFTVSQKTGRISAAILTVEGVPFAFTENFDLVVMCDEGLGFYFAPDLKGTFKKYGNYSDFADSRKVASLVSDDLTTVPIDIVMNEIRTFNDRKVLTAKAQEVADKADWNVIAEKLQPYVKAIQSLNVVTELKVFG